MELVGCSWHGRGQKTGRGAKDPGKRSTSDFSTSRGSRGQSARSTVSLFFFITCRYFQPSCRHSVLHSRALLSSTFTLYGGRSFLTSQRFFWGHFWSRHLANLAHNCFTWCSDLERQSSGGFASGPAIQISSCSCWIPTDMSCDRYLPLSLHF